MSRMYSGPDIFGDTRQGVPNPNVPHVHPYPTRYHGPIFNQPMFGKPYAVNPYATPPYAGVGQDEPALPMANPLAVQAALDAKAAAAQPAPTAQPPGWASDPLGLQVPPFSVWPMGMAWRTVSMAASAYHGYKRNNSIGWAAWWGLMGTLFPVFTPVVAIAQGFDKPKGK